jgi:hypothetical protein
MSSSEDYETENYFDGQSEDEFDRSQQGEFGEYKEDKSFQMEMGALGEGGRINMSGSLDYCSSIMEPTKRGPITNFVNSTYIFLTGMYDGEDDHTLYINPYLKLLCASSIDFSRWKIASKNPIGMYLGYVASKKGKGITKNSMNEALSMLKKDKNIEGVFPPDVVRYAVFWTKITGKYP